MHLILMHNSILLLQTLVLTGPMMFFQILESLLYRRPWLHNLAVKKASSLLLMSYLIMFIKVNAKYYGLSLHEKEKKYFRMMWIAIYIVGWQMEPWTDVVGGGSICTGKYYLGLNNQCHQCSCAVNEALTMRLGMGRESHLWSSPFRMSTDCQFLTL